MLVPYAAGGARVARPSTAGDPVPLRPQRVRQRRPRPAPQARRQLRARRHRQPRLRPGRGRPGGRQPDRLRDLLPGEAAVLRRGRADLRQLRPQRARTTTTGTCAASPTCSTRGGSAARRRARRRARTSTRRARPRSSGRPRSRARAPAAGASGVLEAVTGREEALWADGPSERAAGDRAAHELLRRAREPGPRPSRLRLPAHGREPRAVGSRARGDAGASAYVGGVDGYVFLDPAKDWVVSGRLAGSERRGQPLRDRASAARGHPLLPAPRPARAAARRRRSPRSPAGRAA